MEYLISEGYPEAAQRFALEANIEPELDVESIQERVEIREAIAKGDIQTAIEKINELNPQVSPGLSSPPTCCASWRIQSCYDEICSCTTHRPFGVLMRKQLKTTSVFSLSTTLSPSLFEAADIGQHAKHDIRSLIKTRHYTSRCCASS